MIFNGKNILDYSNLSNYARGGSKASICAVIYLISKRLITTRAASTGPSPNFKKAAQLGPPDYSLLLDWGLAYDGVNQPENALAKLRQAAAMEPGAHCWPKSWTPNSPRPTHTRAWYTWRRATPRPPWPI